MQARLGQSVAGLSHRKYGTGVTSGSKAPDSGGGEMTGAWTPGGDAGIGIWWPRPYLGEHLVMSPVNSPGLEEVCSHVAGAPPVCCRESGGVSARGARRGRKE